MRLRRSELSTPASSRRMITKAAGSTADLVFLDLEDSVAPNQKADARANAVWGLNTLNWGGKTRALRINGVQTPYAHDDVIEVVTGARDNLDVIILPKARSADEVRWVHILLHQLEIKLALANRIGLEILIEDVEAFINVDAMARCSDRLEALIFGPGDFSASQGVTRSGIGWGTETGGAGAGDPFDFVRNRIAIAARAAGLEAIDGPFDRLGEIDTYRLEATRAAAKGYSGKWAIHPEQIEPANEVFSVPDADVAVANAVVEAYEAALLNGDGAIAIDGRMVDAASVRPLRDKLQRAGAVARLTSERQDAGLQA